MQADAGCSRRTAYGEACGSAAGCIPLCHYIWRWSYHLPGYLAAIMRMVEELLQVFNARLPRHQDSRRISKGSSHQLQLGAGLPLGNGPQQHVVYVGA